MKAQWTEGRYNFHYLVLSPKRELQVVVGWHSFKPRDSEESAGFMISFCGSTLKDRPSDLNKAKQLGEEWARQVLMSALEQL